MTTNYFFLLKPIDKWGDYGHTLIHGHGAIDEENGVCNLFRTGPFIPPFTQPNAIIVTDFLRRRLERSRLTGISIIPVHKKKIVELNWHEWDRDAAEPELYPDSGEPNDYIDGGEHSPRAARAMGDLWALRIPKVAQVMRTRPVVESTRELRLILASTRGLDFVGSEDVGYYFVSERAKNWLQAHVGDWVTFELASTR